MRFLLHGSLDAAVGPALAAREHHAHATAELPAELSPADPVALLEELEKRQWNLLTSDSAFVRDVYEKKIPFPGIIVQILDDLPAAAERADAIARLFERYKRLTPRRLYTVTKSRVKIRQLPGGHVT